MSKKNVSTSRQKLMKLVQLALLTAILVVLAFTPLGYLRVGVLSITFLTVPVAIGAIVLGPAAGLFLGTVFGLTSFIQCLTGDPFGAALLSISPVYTFIVCVLPRMLVGLFTGLIFKFLSNLYKSKIGSFLVASVVCPLMNTLFFTSTLFLFFINAPVIADIRAASGAANIFAFAVSFVGINGLVEVAVCGVVGFAVSKALHSALKHMTV